jgi:hypothetical protein
MGEHMIMSASSSTRIRNTPLNLTQTVTTTNGRLSSRQIWLPLHIHVHPSRHARRLRQAFREKVDGNASSAKMLSIGSKVRSSPPHTHS